MFRSPTHLELIRSLSCCFCGKAGETEAAHIRKFGDGGMGIKPSDDRTVPLCAFHHRIQHHIGEMKFWGGADEIYRAIDYAKSLVGKTQDEAELTTRDFRKTVIA